jgi:hypothetical protein
MRAVQNFFIQGLPFFFLLLYFLRVPDASALQRGEVVIDGRVTITVEVVQTAQEQARGLGGRSSLLRGRGMLFPFDAAKPRVFWMKGMLIPIDILWIREGKLVAIDANIAPPRLHETPAVVSQVADMVLEVPAGFAQEMGVTVGQMVRIRYEGSSR